MTRRILGAAVLALALGAAGTARADGAGTTAFQFLTLGSGARIESMGEAGTAWSDGVDALTWNPARLGVGDAREVSVSYFNWLQDVQVAQGGATWPVGKMCLGVGAKSLRVDDFGNVPGEAEVGQTDLAVGAGLAYPLLPSLRAGAGVKVIRSSLADEDATGFAGDVGLNYEWVEGWNLAAAVRNFGPGFGYGDGPDESLPTQGAVGLAASVGKLTVDSEVLWEEGPGWGGALGAEYRFRERVLLRGGSRLGEEPDGAREPWSAGIGIAARSDLELEYAYRDGKLETSHRLGIRWIPGRTLGAPGGKARSSKEFYIAVLNDAFERGLATLPPRPEGTVLVRASAPNEAAEVIANNLTRYLQGLGWEAEAGKAYEAFPDSMPDEEREKWMAQGVNAPLKQPLLQFDIRESRYEILGSHRQRWVGPKSVDREAAVNLDFTLTLPGVEEPVWTGSAAGSERQLVAVDRIPASGGYPQARMAESVGGGKRHPLVEPAIVGGLVAGLAVIFFSNRDVGQ